MRISFCISLILLLFSGAIFAQNNSNQTSYYYYYQGQKIYLNLNTQKLYLDAKTDFDANQLNNQGLLAFTVNNENEPINGEVKKWAKIELENQLTETEYFQKLDDLKLASTSIDLIQPSFITMDGFEIDMSSYFYVKLNQVSDLTLLQQEAINKNVLIIEQNQFMPLWYTLRLTSQTNDNTLNISNYFYETGNFAYSVADFLSDDLLCSNDTDFNQLWGLQNDSNPNIDINICDAWSITEGLNINVAVLDQGIELTHNDLSQNIASISYDTESNSSPSQIFGDHGTHVAGTIGAIKDNNLQVVGVAPSSTLISISNSLQGIPNSRIKRADGINWAWQNGVDIISNSWRSAVQYDVIDEAIENALTNGRGGLGTIVVFSAGNSGNTNPPVNYPANSNPNILAVGSITSYGSRSNFSSYSDELDIVAPGSSILSTVLNNNTGVKSGTSMAAPYVSGIAALILSVNPDLTALEVNNIIEETAQKVGCYNYSNFGARPNGTWNEEMGYGLVDAHQAVLQAESMLDCDSDIIIIGPDILPYGQQATYTTNYAGVSNGVLWSTSPAFTIVSTNGEDEVIIEASGIFDGILSAKIGCMQTDKEIIIYEQQEIVPYPNSSDESFNLDFSTYPPNTIYYIYIYDQYQNEVYIGESTNIEKTINTVNLPSDTYYLHVYINGELTSKQLIVQH